MELTKITPLACIMFIVVFFGQVKFTKSRPSMSQTSPIDMWAAIHEDDPPSHVRPIRLYSKQGHYVAILDDGRVEATRNASSEDGKF